MKENIQNLIKNAINENAVKFKDQASQVLYSKVGDRLKQEYINVSKSMFKNFNEAVGGMPDAMYASDEVMVAPPGRGTGGSGTGPGNKPKDKPERNEDPGPPPENPYPNGIGQRPVREGYPKGKEGDERFMRDLYEWQVRLEEYNRYLKALKEWRAAHDSWRNRPRGRS